VAGSGNDTIYANGGEDFIDSGLGFDTVWLGGGDATVLVRTSRNAAVSDDYVTINNFQLGATKLQVRGGIPATDLSFADSAEGAQILLDDDLLAVVSWQNASTFSNNVSEIFVA
jgi:Ca2+-binding RTX toxin-like protein